MVANAIQQQMTLNHQTTMNQWDVARAIAATFIVNQPQEQMGLIEFLRYNPSTSSGKTTPDQVDHWIRKLEKISRATFYPKDKKLEFATYMLTGEVEFWWMGAQQMIKAKAEVLDWENFKVRFLERLFFFVKSYNFQYNLIKKYNLFKKYSSFK